MLALTAPVSAQNEFVQSSRSTADTALKKEMIVSALQTIPANVRDAVFGAGCRVVVVSTVNEQLGTGYNDKPQGYTGGGGYDNADGLFVPEKNQMLVAEKVSYRNGAPVKAVRIQYVVRHEFGHAYDQFLGRRSSKEIWTATSLPKFINVHQSEVQRLSNSARADLAYFCQTGSAGASETFAELFCIHCSSERDWSKQQKALLIAFPQTDLLVKAAMNNPDSVATWSPE